MDTKGQTGIQAGTDEGAIVTFICIGGSNGAMHGVPVQLQRGRCISRLRATAVSHHAWETGHWFQRGGGSCVRRGKVSPGHAPVSGYLDPQAVANDIWCPCKCSQRHRQSDGEIDAAPQRYGSYAGNWLKRQAVLVLCGDWKKTFYQLHDPRDFAMFVMTRVQFGGNLSKWQGIALFLNMAGMPSLIDRRDLHHLGVIKFDVADDPHIFQISLPWMGCPRRHHKRRQYAACEK